MDNTKKFKTGDIVLYFIKNRYGYNGIFAGMIIQVCDIKYRVKGYMINNYLNEDNGLFL